MGAWRTGKAGGALSALRNARDGGDRLAGRSKTRACCGKLEHIGIEVLEPALVAQGENDVVLGGFVHGDALHGHDARKQGGVRDIDLIGAMVADEFGRGGGVAGAKRIEAGNGLSRFASSRGGCQAKRPPMEMAASARMRMPHCSATKPPMLVP